MDPIDISSNDSDDFSESVGAEFYMGAQFPLVALFYEARRLQIFSNRIEVIINNGVFTEQRDFYSNMIELSILILDSGSNQGTPQYIKKIITKVDKLLEQIKCLDLGPHSTKAYIRINEIEECIIRIQNYISEISQALYDFQKEQKQNPAHSKDPIPLMTDIFLEPISETNFGQKDLSCLNEDCIDFINKFLTILTTENIIKPTGDGYTFTDEDLIIPNISGQLMELTRFISSPKQQGRLSFAFINNVKQLLSSPTTERIAFETLKEFSRIEYRMEFNGELLKNQEFVKIDRALTDIHLTYFLISMYHFLNVVDFSASSYLISIRSLSTIVIGRDIMEKAFLYDSLESESVENVRHSLKDIDNSDGNSAVHQDQSLQTVKSAFVPIVKSFFHENTQEYYNLLIWSLKAEDNEYGNRVFDIPEQFKDIAESIDTLSRSRTCDGAISKATKSLMDMLGLANIQTEFAQEADSLLTDTGNVLKDLGIVTEAMETPKFETLFAPLTKATRLFVSEHPKIAKPLVLVVDHLARGCLDSASLVQLINVLIDIPSDIDKNIRNSLFGSAEALILGWRYLLLKGKSLKRFNAISFSQLYANALLYLNTVFEGGRSELFDSGILIKQASRELDTNINAKYKPLDNAVSAAFGALMKADINILYNKIRKLLTGRALDRFEEYVHSSRGVFSIDFQLLQEIYNTACANGSIQLMQIAAGLNTIVLFKRSLADANAYFCFRHRVAGNRCRRGK